MRGQLEGGGWGGWDGVERDCSGWHLPGSGNRLLNQQLTASCCHTTARLVRWIAGPDPTGQAEYGPKLDQSDSLLGDIAMGLRFGISGIQRKSWGPLRDGETGV